MSNQKLRLKGLSISKIDFEEKYQVELSNVEWQSITTLVSKSWEEQIGELKLLAFRHIRRGMSEIGFAPHLNGQDIGFKKG